MIKNMMSKAVLLASLAVTAFSMPKIDYDVSPAFDIVDSVYPITSTVNGEYSQGSGFMIDGVFVTNYHVSGGGSETVIHADEDIPIDAGDIVFADESLDLIAYDIDAGESLKSGSLPVQGAKVYAIGYPRNKLDITEGSVMMVMRKYGSKMIMSRLETDYGSSGGVLINRKGEVVGMTTRMSDDKTISSSIPIGIMLEAIGDR